MGRLTSRTPVTRITLTSDGPVAGRRRPDSLAVEEPLEIRVAGEPFTVTMRTPGHDVELAAGFLVSEGVISHGGQFRSAIHCGGPGSASTADDGNTYNVLDLALAAGVAAPAPDLARHHYTTSSCGVCGSASIEAVRKQSVYDIVPDETTVQALSLLTMPETLRAGQTVFDKTGGLHAAALFDAATGEMHVLREDVGRHNAVDKVIGWAVLNDLLPLRGTVLQVSGRASFELVQKATMAGIPILQAVSAPSSLAVELAESSGLTLVGFARGSSLNVYTHPERVSIGD